MATSSGYVEGQSVSRPPYFNGSNYGYWKTQMDFFLQSLDFEMWELIEDGYIPPTSDRSKWSAAQTKRAALDGKGVNTIFCALSPDEFNRVSTCKTAKDIWTILEISHEGTSQVKKSKVSLVSDLEAFKMNENESISEMYSQNIVNELSSLELLYGKVQRGWEVMSKKRGVWETETGMDERVRVIEGGGQR
ncbi:uncharacterized protein LOC143855458 [Tasmannia lanceolata]|uniref:uncharacterized protein LOC143855458 n=1 Tax=Tasmannia lanceolata TaxID=3420 RepID=UPI0040627C36